MTRPADKSPVNPPGSSARRDVLLGTGFFLALALAGWAGTPALAAVSTATAASLAAPLVRASGGRPAHAIAAAVISAAFPFAIALDADAGAFWGAALSLFTAAAALLGSSVSQTSASARQGAALRTTATLTFVPLYAGFGLSHSILISQAPSGRRLLLSACVMVAAYQAATKGGWTTLRQNPARLNSPRRGARSRAGTAVTSPTLAGLAASVVAALACLLFLGPPFSAWPAAILGLLVGCASLLGIAAGKLVRAEFGQAGRELGLLRAVEPGLLGLPAFLYGFRLFLT